MNFSYEELYFMYGQYDRFVQLSFHRDSEADKNVAIEYFMGSFKYSHEEIKALEELRGKENIPRTEKRVRFVPSELHEISADQQTFLDRDGILCSDICLVSARNFPKENRYTVKGVKEIPYTITVNVDFSDVNTDMLTLGLYKSRLKSGHVLRDFEWEEFYGLKYYYEKESIEAEKRIYSDGDGKILKEGIRYHFLMAKYLNDATTEEEMKDLINLGKAKNSLKVNLLIEELKKGSEKIKEIAKVYQDKIGLIYSILFRFEDEVLVPFKFSIWWDSERFLHIYLRHVNETQLGERFEGKSVFQYKFKEIKRLISIVIERAYDEIVQHFQEKPDKMFVRMGDRAINYDGNFYRVEIEPSGRLREFHPYLTREEQNKDN
ncbi:MAG: hypothetical protein WAQ28_20270 [Bacteroidia bacterium]